jgi:ParB-like chromosome segregation protein Spo0J
MSRPNGKIKIECAHDKIVALADLKEHPGNPNKHSLEQIKLLAKIIRVSGWRNPIVVSNRSGLITKGHARLKPQHFWNRN